MSGKPVSNTAEFNWMSSCFLIVQVTLDAEQEISYFSKVLICQLRTTKILWITHVELLEEKTGQKLEVPN